MQPPGMTPERPLAVAHIGAFSMPNWGDKLYPGALARLFDTVGVPARMEYFCPLPGSTSAGEPIRRLREVRHSSADVAFVGGGDVFRFDSRTVALDHLSVPSSRRGNRVARLRAKLFASRNFLSGPGPWVPQEPWLTDRPAVLISAGVHTIPPTESARAAVRNYRAAWVRTQNGADLLTGAGIARERVIVAPDMIFALPEYAKAERVRARGEQLFHERLGLSDAPIVVQAAEFHGWPVDRVRRVLESLRGLPVATLSLGAYAGEDRLLAEAARPLGIPSLIDLDADDITAVLAAAGAVFTTSMHAAIVGASFGTPALVPGIGKTRAAFAVCPEPPTIFEVDEDTLRETATRLRGTRVAHSVDANRDAVIAAFRATLEAADLV